MGLSTLLGADFHLLAAVDTVPDTTREQASPLCERAGLELLVLDKHDLRASCRLLCLDLPVAGLLADA